ncbi:hypothetical protein M0R19_03760 [Candidatus Pacearchaeota archaeon]|jgi:hypothetical protein|nr:hypothetical protein [Candidatus Pacearchaeota archaeon]
MILTGKMYVYKQSENNVYFHLEIDKNWFITNILSNIPQCFNCNNVNKNSCLFLYSCLYKDFHCTNVPSIMEYKLIEKLDNTK